MTPRITTVPTQTTTAMTTMTTIRILQRQIMLLAVITTILWISTVVVVGVVDARAILGVDMGSLYMKVALVQSGHPIEIVTNLHSKRKTEQMILFDGTTAESSSHRGYGADAAALLQRKAHLTPTAMSIMLGRTDQHPIVKVLKERHYPIVPTFNTTRNGVTIQVDGISFTPEELVAMVLRHAVDISVAYAAEGGSTIAPPNDMVLTVPSFATMAERRALLDASTLADMNVLTLIDENTAAALHYAMDKNFDPPNNAEQILLFYNLGAAALQISIIRFFNYDQPQKFGGKPKSTPALEVLSKSWDATCGGDAFDHVIVEYLADQFNEAYRAKFPNQDNIAQFNVRNHTRPMTKLRIQANKVKHVLSANVDIPIYIDGVYDDIPLQTHLTRTQFESFVAPLIERATIAPIQRALDVANLTLDQLTGIELLGGGMRIPRIQQELKQLMPSTMELGYHINSDESFALGAAFAGANISTAFRVRPVGMTDINPFAIGVALSNLFNNSDTATNAADDTDDDSSSTAWSKTATIFKAFGKMGVKKTIAFTHTQNIHCGLDYIPSDVLPMGTELGLVRYNITGVPEFIIDLATQHNLTGMKPKISLQFELSTSGLVSLIKAEAAVEETYTVQEEVAVEDDDITNSTTSNTTTTTTTNDTDTVNNTGKENNITTPDRNATDETATVNVTANTTTANATKPKRTILVDKIFGIRRKSPTFLVRTKEKKRVHKKSLTVETYYVGSVQPHSKELLSESSAKLYEMAERDKDRMMLEAAKNKVESYIYKIKNKLSDDEASMEKFATEKERTNVQQLAEKAEDWLYDDGSTADLATMETKYDEISQPFEAILTRIRESVDRPKALEALNKKLTDIESLMVQWETSKPQINTEEREAVLKLVDDVRKWVDEKEKVQAKSKDHDDPTYLSVEIPLQVTPVETLVVKLGRKPKPIVKKNETDTNSTNSTTNQEFNASSTNTTLMNDDGDDTANSTTTNDTSSSTTTNTNESNTNNEEIPAQGGIQDDEL